MTTKAKKTTSGTADSPFAAFGEMFKSFEGSDISEMSKENFEAFSESANAAVRGLREIGEEITSYQRKSMEEGIEAAKTIMAAKSVPEFMQLQSDFLRSSIDAYVSEMSKISELSRSAAQDAFEPLKSRASAVKDTVVSATTPAAAE